MPLFRLAWLLLALPLTTACSSGDSSDPGTTGAGINDPQCAGALEFYVGIEQTSAGGYKVALVEAEPAPPHVGDNRWVVRIVDANGAPVEGASLIVKSVMPAHGHPSPRTAQVTPEGDGKYELNPVNFNMSKLWKTTIEITPSGAAAGSTPESVTFSFCVVG